MSLGLTILSLLARYLPLAIQAVEAGRASFESIHTVAAQIQASAAAPSDADRIAAETAIAKLEAVLRADPA
ncbi:MAG TPA: hypothetical protein VN632_10445 [Stellaceae bacterium]|nr:hypothetical protein [Stellaceae bacterium]